MDSVSDPRKGSQSNERSSEERSSEERSEIRTVIERQIPEGPIGKTEIVLMRPHGEK
jgi:hypothetical protein